MKHVLCALVLVLVVSACGGRGLDEPRGTTPQAPIGYTNPGYVRPTYPHATGSHWFYWGNTYHIGADVEPKEKLRKWPGLLPGDIEVSLGASRDGVGYWRLSDYKADLERREGAQYTDGLHPFRVRPRLWIRGDTTLPLLQNILGSVAILNDVLPPEFQIEIAGTFDTATEFNRLRRQEGSVLVSSWEGASIASPCSADAVACADRYRIGRNTFSSVVHLPKDLHESGYTFSYSTILHELIHALGVWGHVESVQFPDSIMGVAGEMFPNPGFVLHRIDKEVLQAIYMEQVPAHYNTWGEWTDTTLHLAATTDDGIVNFGVALFNGLPQPWARGPMPEMELKDNPELTVGPVTWEGAMVGFSGISPLMGDTRLEVNLRTLQGQLGFRDIFFVNRFDQDDDKWFPQRNIDYDVHVIGNGFWNTNGNGHVVGAFMGPKHEGMAGTVKRTDLVGAFGGKR